MFENLNLFRLSGALARHAGQRQTVISQNVAQADTPGYRARDLPAFSELTKSRGTAPRATRAGHLIGADPPGTARAFEVRAPADLNGNTVSLEDEILKAVGAKRDHDKALGIYRTSLRILRSSLGRR